MKWGLVGGAALGLVFPPSIIGSAVALGAGGAALGKAHQLHDKIELEKDLSDAVAPGHSGIVALVSDPGAVEIREALAKANGIVESRRQRRRRQGHPRHRGRGREGLTSHLPHRWPARSRLGGAEPAHLRVGRAFGSGGPELP